MAKSDLWKKGYVLAYGSRGIKVHHGEDTWQQAADLVARAGS